MENVAHLEVHYYLQDGLHSMDALVRNRCEAEFLAAAGYITEKFGIELFFEATVPEQGGFRDIWRLVAKNINQPWIGSVFTPLVVTLITIWNAPAKPNPELERQQIEMNRLAILHSKLENRRTELEIRKLEGEIHEQTARLEEAQHEASQPAAQPAPPKHAGQKPLSADASSSASSAKTEDKPMQLQMDAKVVTRRSNFYKQLVGYSKVTAVGYRARLGPQADEIYIERVAFSDFIMQSNWLEPEVSEEVIEIVSPVLSPGDLKWKGRRNGEVISFAMNDRSFRDEVYHNDMSFRSGDSIRCVLEADRELDAVGAERVKGYRVTTVIERIESTGKIHQRAQGRMKRFLDKQPDDAQPDMFGHGIV
ncbi:hypothetical protein [Caballeronia sp. NCTM5]|uniref:hypothetical protein n=1 Tax=Caballeronia sp. NCTM5 TaxID=2921755 RepID=UPI002028955D|nr:hypothetical protein [Caballeronia sp. NCTM5]